MTEYDPDAGLQLVAKIASVRHSIPIDDALTMLRDRDAGIQDQANLYGRRHVAARAG